MRYWDLVIGSIDMDYINKLSEALDVDYYDCELYNINDMDSASLTNTLIEYIIMCWIIKLEIRESLKDLLIDNIYLNCFDSWIYIELDKLNANEEEKEIIQEFIDTL